MGIPRGSVPPELRRLTATEVIGTRESRPTTLGSDACRCLLLFETLMLLPSPPHLRDYHPGPGQLLLGLDRPSVSLSMTPGNPPPNSNT